MNLQKGCERNCERESRTEIIAVLKRRPQEQGQCPGGKDDGQRQGMPEKRDRERKRQREGGRDSTEVPRRKGKTKHCVLPLCDASLPTESW